MQRCRRILAALVFCACASPPPPAEQVDPPFDPRMVELIEPGFTDHHRIRDWFGEPVEVEQQSDGSRIWRFDHRVPQEADQPPLFLQALAQAWRATVSWVDETFFYPPPQPRPPRMVLVPATIHGLEVSLGADGVVRDYQYRRRLGAVSVPAPD